MSRALTVGEVMTKRVQTVPPDATMSRAHSLMRRHRIRHLVVTLDDHLLGVVSQRDLHLIETLKDVDPDEVQVEEAMSAQPYVVPPSAPVSEVARTMWKRKVGAAVVARDAHVLGVFTTTDALRVLAELTRPAKALSTLKVARRRRSP